MVSSRRATSADKQVLREAEKTGIAVSTRQLERWRACGSIPKPTPRALGYGKGKSTSYSDDQLGYVVEFARRAAPRRRASQITMWMFLDGIDVPESDLRTALLDQLDLIDAAIRRLAGTDDQFDAVDVLTQTFARGRSAAGKSRREKVRATFQSLRADGALQPVEDFATERVEPPKLGQFQERLLYTTFSLTIAGEPTDLDSATELAAHTLKHLGLAEDMAGPFSQEQVEEFVATAVNLRFDEVVRIAEEIPFDLLVGGRDALRSDHLLADVFGVRRGGPPDPVDVLAPVLAAELYRRYFSHIAGHDLSWAELSDLVLSGETPGQVPD